MGDTANSAARSHTRRARAFGIRAGSREFTLSHAPPGNARRYQRAQNQCESALIVKRMVTNATDLL
jgi:hypothetical protein